MEQAQGPEEPPRLLASYRRVDFIRPPAVSMRGGKSAGLMMVMMMIFTSLAG